MDPRTEGEEEGAPSISVLSLLATGEVPLDRELRDNRGGTAHGLEWAWQIQDSCYSFSPSSPAFAAKQRQPPPL